MLLYMLQRTYEPRYKQPFKTGERKRGTETDGNRSNYK